VKRVLRLSLAVSSTGEGLRRTGLVVVNPPFVFEEEARRILTFLAPRLAQGAGAGFEIERLAGE
jgi:23S rRNA (adenine2030-N6)-methyltransferase